MTNSIVARRYARALFSIGCSEGSDTLDKIASDLKTLSDAEAKSGSLSILFKSPLFSAAEKFKVVEELLNNVKADVITIRFCQLLSEKGRLSKLSEIVASFNNLLDTEKNILRGELITAIALNDVKRKTVLEQLEGQIKHSLVLTYSTDPSLLGGVVFKVGDRVLDASLKAQLSILKENIKRGE